MSPHTDLSSQSLKKEDTDCDRFRFLMLNLRRQLVAKVIKHVAKRPKVLAILTSAHLCGGTAGLRTEASKAETPVLSPRVLLLLLNLPLPPLLSWKAPCAVDPLLLLLLHMSSLLSFPLLSPPFSPSKRAVAHSI